MALTAQIPIQYDKPQIKAELNFDYKYKCWFVHSFDNIQIKSDSTCSWN
jgi:hypothetical protein